MEAFAEYGTAGGLVLLVLFLFERIYKVVKPHNGSNNKMIKCLTNIEHLLEDNNRNTVLVKDFSEKTYGLVRDLFKMHDVKDEDGVPVWYVRKSLEDTIISTSEAMKILATNISTQTEVFQTLVFEIKSMRTELNDISRR